MTKWWKYSWMLSVTAMAALMMLACAKKNNDGGPAALACPAGLVSNGVTCVTGLNALGGSSSKIGFYAQTVSVTNYANAGSAMNLQSAYSNILKEAMGTCDRDHANGGTAACPAWVTGMNDMVLMFPNGQTSNSASLVFRSYPKNIDPYYTYAYSLPSPTQFFASWFGINLGNLSGVFNPLVLNSTIWPINNSKGFEVRAYGPTYSYSSNKLFQLQVTGGKIEDATLNFVLYFNGQSAITGTLVKCQTQNCGISGL